MFSKHDLLKDTAVLSILTQVSKLFFFYLTVRVCIKHHILSVPNEIGT